MKTLIDTTSRRGHLQQMAQYQYGIQRIASYTS